MIMEAYEGSVSSLSGFMGRRRRSSLVRKPRDIKRSLDSFTFLPPSTQANIVLSNEGNQRFRNTDSFDGSLSENRLKLKLKLGGVTRTFQTKSEEDMVKGNVSEQRHVQKTMYLGEIHPYETVNGGSMCEKQQQGVKEGLMDQEPDIDEDDDGDEEIRYLKKLKSKRVIREDNEQLLDITERQKQRMGIVDSLTAGAASGQIPNTRTRAFQSGKDLCSSIGSGLLEFPDGLPCPSSKRQKQKLSEVEQQFKKAEAAQRRRMQSEKAAKEAEAEAIRKILGQDSGRKKKEEKLKKQQEERAQERAARSRTLESNTVRLVISQSGTTMTFSEDIGLPEIFKRITNRYPPPREKCVGPNCEKAYKYRDSKLKLPICSLTCYKAIQDKDPTLLIA